jgi:hypothetical protein
MELIEIAISAGITTFSLGLLLISLISYRTYRNPKLIFISLVFVLLLVKGVLFSLSLFTQEFLWLRRYIFTVYSGLFDVCILILLFIGTLKR